MFLLQQKCLASPQQPPQQKQIWKKMPPSPWHHFWPIRTFLSKKRKSEVRNRPFFSVVPLNFRKAMFPKFRAREFEQRLNGPEKTRGDRYVLRVKRRRLMMIVALMFLDCWCCWLWWWWWWWWWWQLTKLMMKTMLNLAPQQCHSQES